MLMFGRNQQNSVKQLPFNLKVNKLIKKLIQKSPFWNQDGWEKYQ